MSTTSKSYDLGIIYTGQTVCVPLEHIKNSSGATATDVIVKLKSIPDGLEYNSSQLGRGTYDIYSRIWTIGVLAPGEEVSGLLCFTVLDDSEAPFQFTFTIGLSDHCEACETPIEYCVTLKGITCTDMLDCGMLRVASGTYDDDVDAEAGGVEVGEYYELSENNLYGLPAGGIKKRTL